MASDIVTNLAKNSVMLYIRSFIVMFIGLYTSRYILQNLGIEDYGIYTVVGSIVVFFSFFSGSFSSACLRFYNVAKGKNDHERLVDTFTTSVNILLVIALVMAVLAECVGYYLLQHELQIPAERMGTAICVFHISVVTMVSSMVCIPFTSLIVANEKMSIYAYVDIIVCILKFLAAFILPYIPYDSLLIYALLILTVQFINQGLCCFYCVINFKEASIKFRINKHIAKELMSFSSWVILNAVSSILVFQGLSILYNIFWGITANAALGVANQVKSCALKFTQNISLSIEPQLTKNYAKDELQRVSMLFLTGSKLIYSVFSVMVVLLLVFPDYILGLWLKEVPQYSVGFTRILLINCIVGFIGCMSSTVISATGNIKKFQIVNALISYLALLFSFFSFKLFNNVYLPYIIIAFSSLIQSLYNIRLACTILNFSYFKYVFSFSRLIGANLIVLIIGICHNSYLTFSIFCVKGLILILLLMIVEFFLGFEHFERRFIVGVISKIFKLKK